MPRSGDRSGKRLSGYKVTHFILHVDKAKALFLSLFRKKQRELSTFAQREFAPVHKISYFRKQRKDKVLLLLQMERNLQEISALSPLHPS